MKNIIFIILIVLSTSINAESFKSEKEIQGFTKSLMSKILKEDFKKAFDSAKPYWPIPVVEIDGIVNQINTQWPIVNQRFGKAVGAELVKKERIGKSFLRYYYLHKFEKHAVYWKIDLYKPKIGWKINSISFGDELDSLYK